MHIPRWKPLGSQRCVFSSTYFAAGCSCIDVFLGTARRADVGPLHEIGKEDSKPIKWRRIISIGRLRMAKVHREHAPKAARAADDRRGMRSGHICSTHDFKLRRAHEKIARGNVVHYDFASVASARRHRSYWCCDQLSRNISEIRLKSPGLQRSSGNRSRHRGAEASPCQRRLLRSRNPGSDAEVHSRQFARPETSERGSTRLRGRLLCRQPRRFLQPGFGFSGTTTKSVRAQ